MQIHLTHPVTLPVGSGQSTLPHQTRSASTGQPEQIQHSGPAQSSRANRLDSPRPSHTQSSTKALLSLPGQFASSPRPQQAARPAAAPCMLSQRVKTARLSLQMEAQKLLVKLSSPSSSSQCWSRDKPGLVARPLGLLLSPLQAEPRAGQARQPL